VAMDRTISFKLESHSIQDTPKLANFSPFLGIYYLFFALMNGVVIIGMEVNLLDFSKLCSTSLDQANFALTYRSLGSVAGALLSAPIFSRFDSHYCLVAFLAANSLLLAVACQARTIVILNMLFFLFGFCVAIINAGVVLTIRKIYASESGPWLQSMCFFFQAGVISVPGLLHFFEIYSAYAALSFFGFAICLAGFLVPRPEIVAQGSGTAPSSNSKKCCFVDFVIAICCFFNSGIIVETFALLPPYMEAMKNSMSYKPHSISLWLSITILIGQLASVKLQQLSTVSMLYLYITGTSVIAICCMFWIVVQPYDAMVFWLNVCFFGLAWGPITGLLYDVWNKRTQTTVNGTSIVMFGSLAGSGIYSYITYNYWMLLRWPQFLMVGNIIGLLSTVTCSYFSLECLEVLFGSNTENTYIMMSTTAYSCVDPEFPAEVQVDSK